MTQSNLSGGGNSHHQRERETYLNKNQTRLISQFGFKCTGKNISAQADLNN